MCQKKHSALLFRRSPRQTREARGLELLDTRCERSAWRRSSASQFVNHLFSTHHPHLAQRLRRVEKSIVNVAASHGLAHGHTWELAKMFVELSELLRGAMASEARNLGPILEDSGVYDQDPYELDIFCIDHEQTHEEITAMFDRMQPLASADVSGVPCAAYQAMIDEIAALEQDYQTHWLEQQCHADLLQHA